MHHAHLLPVGVPAQRSLPEGALDIALRDQAPLRVQPQHGVVAQEVPAAAAVAAAPQRALMAAAPGALLAGLAPALPPTRLCLRLDSRTPNYVAISGMYHQAAVEAQQSACGRSNDVKAPQMCRQSGEQRSVASLSAIKPML